VFLVYPYHFLTDEGNFFEKDENMEAVVKYKRILKII
jgi:hypothetical protein